MLQAIRSDIQATLRRDPAARSWLEVVLCYPGLHAILLHRVAHWLWTRGFRLTARFLSQVSRFFTGIEIHPGAVIGQEVLIDHGMGTVVGETAEVGDGCTLYQGVTLGGTGKQTGKRHPTLGKRVVVGVGASVLGSIEIGDDVLVGAGSVVLHPIPADCTVVGVPARVVKEAGKRVAAATISGATDFDPCERCQKAFAAQFEELERRVDEMQEAILRTGVGR